MTIIGGSVIAAVILLAGGGDSETNVCDNPLAPPIGGSESDISERGFQAQDEGLTRVIEAATAGDVEATEAAFFGDVQNFVHDVDEAIREVDEALAKRICERLVDIEEELAFDQRLAVIAAHATKIRQLLRDGAEALGFARPGE